jgi:transposase
MEQQRAYTYRFYPTETQKHLLARTFGCCRYVYNWALRERTDAYYKHGQRIGYHETSAALTLLKQREETAWLAEVASVPLQQALRHLDRAFRNFFEGRAAYPSFKKKGNQQSATYVGSAFTWDAGRLTLARMSLCISGGIVPCLRDASQAVSPSAKMKRNAISSLCYWKRRSSHWKSLPRWSGLTWASSRWSLPVMDRAMATPDSFTRMRRSWRKLRDGMPRRKQARRTVRRLG